MEKELALAAYDIVREERAAKTARMTDIQDFYIKALINKQMEGNEPKGTLRTVMKKGVITLPDGAEYITWNPIDQVFDKGERAQFYLNMSRMGNKEFGINPGDIIIADDDGVCVVAHENCNQVLLKAKERLENEEEKRIKLASGQLSLDLYNMRKKLSDKGLKYE